VSYRKEPEPKDQWLFHRIKAPAAIVDRSVIATLAWVGLLGFGLTRLL